MRIAHSGTQTASGLVSGTPKYISPEQARGDKVDHCTDIYSLGVVLYELLAGHVPFEGESTLVVIYKHIHEPPPPIANIPPQLQEVVNQALAKNPEERYQSVHELAADFHEAVGVLQFRRQGRRAIQGRRDCESDRWQGRYRLLW